MCWCLWLIYTGVIDCDEWKTEKRHECTNMGKVKRLNYDDKCTSRDFQFVTWKISGRLIFLEQRVRLFER